MREPDKDWDEFDWERALRESDDFAVRYFQLLRRFYDLPGANELIAHHMGADFEESLPDCTFECEECGGRWQCEFASPLDWNPESREMPAEEDVPDPDPESEEPLFFESDPVFVMLRQAAVGWCNIYAAILPPDSRIKGLKILYHVGRSMANLAYSIDDGLSDQPAASIAFTKRSLAQLNHALGYLNQLIREKPRLKKILTTIREHLINANEALLDNLQRYRSGSEKGVA